MSEGHAPWVIWKYALRVDDVIEVEMPWASAILSVQEQNGELTMWAMVNPTEKTEKRIFHVVGTGHKHTERWFDTDHYVGSAQCGPFVWHVFREDA